MSKQYQITQTAAQELDKIFPEYFYFDDDGVYYTSESWLKQALAGVVYRDGGVVDLSTTSLEELILLSKTERAPLPEEFRLYDLIDNYSEDRTITPKSIMLPQQLSGGVHKIKVMKYGERTDEVYYATRNADGTFSDEIARVHYDFKRDANELYLECRTATMSWVLHDGSASMDVKRWSKYYSDKIVQNEEVSRRRANVVEEVVALSVELGLGDKMRELADMYVVEVSSYKNSGSSQLVKAISNDSSLLWLNLPSKSDVTLTIRDMLVKYFSIGLIS